VFFAKKKREKRRIYITMTLLFLYSVCSMTLMCIYKMGNGTHESTVIHYTIYKLALIEHFLTSNIKYDIIGKIIAEV